MYIYIHVSARYSDDLLRYMGQSNTTIEVCLTSNLQTMPDLKHVRDHQVRAMMQEGMHVSLCTDNTLVSNTRLSKELELFVAHVLMGGHTDEKMESNASSCVRAIDGSTARAMKEVVMTGVNSSFFPGSSREKQTYVTDFRAYYDRVIAHHSLAQI